MPASKRVFDGLRFCLNFTYTPGTLGVTGMLISGELFCTMSQEATIDAPAKVRLAHIQPMEVAAGTHSVA